MTVDEIKKRITKLSDEDRAKLRAWWEDQDAAEWDRQMEADAASGKLDKLFEEALGDLKAGRTKEI
ncbi:MAG: hypothetical protein ACRD5L_15505 [Bryobacteraceae bacterium]